MTNKKKITFAKQDLEKFLNSTNLILKSNALSRITGGETYANYIKQVYSNYSQTTFVNHISG